MVSVACQAETALPMTLFLAARDAASAESLEYCASAWVVRPRRVVVMRRIWVYMVGRYGTILKLSDSKEKIAYSLQRDHGKVCS